MFLIIICVVSVLLISYIYHEINREFITIAFLDVGQGDAIFIEAPNGKQILIDGSESSVVVRRLSRILPFYDRSIDMLLVTHHDSDHTGGFPDIFKRFAVDIYATSSRDDNDGLFFELENLAEKEQSDRVVVSAGDKVMLDEEAGVYMKILWPPRDVVIDDNNDSSVVVLLVYGENKFLLMGDAPQEAEENILRAFEDVRSDVLKLGHHGSKTSSAEEFILEVDPTYSIVSVGEGNKFGHPHKEVLDILSKTKTEVLRTSELGTIVFQSDGREIWLVD